MKRILVIKLLISIVILFLVQACHPKTETVEIKNKPPSQDGMILIPAGSFQMGTDDGMSFEAPIHTVKIKAFWMDQRGYGCRV